ncbi:MAG: hypothetical protein WCE69_07495 [Aestuariivirga sp.]
MNREVKLDVVVTHGGEISDDECEDCRRIFGARVLSLYSSGETGKFLRYKSELPNPRRRNA